jgi:CubicO group peptidase (beta-lactamase class C family)
MTPGTYSCTYCISKVPLFLAVVTAIDAGRLTPETPIREILPDANPFVGEATVIETLSQRGGFSTLPGPVSRFVPSHMRRVAHQWLRELEQVPRGAQHYSVSEVGWLAATMLERLHGRHYADVIGSELISAFGAEALPAPSGGLAITYQPTEAGDPVPLLNEGTRAVRTQWNPSLGWYATATAVARLGASINDAWHGRTVLSRDVVRFATRPVAEPVFDPGLNREMSFGLGFWTDPARDVGGLPLSPGSFGHNAQGGTCFMLVDPERELSVAACLDLALQGDTVEGIRRTPLVEAVLGSVDG